MLGGAERENVPAAMLVAMPHVPRETHSKARLGFCDARIRKLAPEMAAIRRFDISTRNGSRRRAQSPADTHSKDGQWSATWQPHRPSVPIAGGQSESEHRALMIIMTAAAEETWKADTQLGLDSRPAQERLRCASLRAGPQFAHGLGHMTQVDECHDGLCQPRCR